ncbi:uncharacterized protein LOC105699485 [Orussus abietinus]|uniref:uncharacterized protein LOC105699485 n=1 Tax=Orussus abietinus TaxID=222816 RepID=UPI000C715E72|nr:uncharacterized protein LOC105699485 [Orussus abietinus]
MFFELLLMNLLASNVAGKPNVLLIVVDDLRTTIGCYGDSNAYTPNIDSLAEESVLFTQAFAQQSLCAPSRNSFLTSRRPDTLQLYDFYSYWRDSVGNFTTLPQHLKDHGFTTMSVGKVFHPGISSNNSDDSPYSWTEKPFHPYTDRYKDATVCTSTSSSLPAQNIVCPVCVPFMPNGTLPDIESLNAARSFIHKHKNDPKPFFLAVGFQKPHIPLKYPKEYLKYHPLDKFAVPDIYMWPNNVSSVAYNPWTDLRKREDVKALLLKFPWEKIPVKFATTIIQSYYAAVTYIDDMIGLLLAQLCISKIRNETIVILTSDHGWSLGEHAEWAKYSDFDVALRIPLIISVPGLTYNIRNNCKTTKENSTVDRTTEHNHDIHRDKNISSDTRILLEEFEKIKKLLMKENETTGQFLNAVDREKNSTINNKESTAANVVVLNKKPTTDSEATKQSDTSDINNLKNLTTSSAGPSTQISNSSELLTEAYKNTEHSLNSQVELTTEAINSSENTFNTHTELITPTPHLTSLVNNTTLPRNENQTTESIESLLKEIEDLMKKENDQSSQNTENSHDDNKNVTSFVTAENANISKSKEIPYWSRKAEEWSDKIELLVKKFENMLRGIETNNESTLTPSIEVATTTVSAEKEVRPSPSVPINKNSTTNVLQHVQEAVSKASTSFPKGSIPVARNKTNNVRSQKISLQNAALEKITDSVEKPSFDRMIIENTIKPQVNEINVDKLMKHFSRVKAILEKSNSVSNESSASSFQIAGKKQSMPEVGNFYTNVRKIRNNWLLNGLRNNSKTNSSKVHDRGILTTSSADDQEKKWKMKKNWDERIKALRKKIDYAETILENLNGRNRLEVSERHLGKGDTKAKNLWNMPDTKPNRNYNDYNIISHPHRKTNNGEMKLKWIIKMRAFQQKMKSTESAVPSSETEKLDSHNYNGTHFDYFETVPNHTKDSHIAHRHDYAFIMPEDTKNTIITDKVFSQHPKFSERKNNPDLRVENFLKHFQEIFNVSIKDNGITTNSVSRSRSKKSISSEPTDSELQDNHKSELSKLRHKEENNESYRRRYRHKHRLKNYSMSTLDGIYEALRRDHEQLRRNHEKLLEDHDKLNKVLKGIYRGHNDVDILEDRINGNDERETPKRSHGLDGVIRHEANIENPQHHKAKVDFELKFLRDLRKRNRARHRSRAGTNFAKTRVVEKKSNLGKKELDCENNPEIINPFSSITNQRIYPTGDRNAIEVKKTSHSLQRRHQPITRNKIYKTVDEMVELVDLFPTIAELVGFPIPICPDIEDRYVESAQAPALPNPCSEGITLIPLINAAMTSKRIPWKKAAFSQYPRPGMEPTLHPNSDKPRLNEINIMGYTLRTKKYRYTAWVSFAHESKKPDWRKIVAEELYDHDLDPGENVNVAGTASFQEVEEKLRMLLRRGWRQALPEQFKSEGQKIEQGLEHSKG